jgi:hypothetical protein
MAAPTRVSTGITIAASHLNQYADRVNRQSTQTEVGSYYFALAAYATSANEGQWVGSLSRDATPASVAIDTSLQAATGYNAPSTTQLNANGFFVQATATGTSLTCRVGGAATITY